MWWRKRRHAPSEGGAGLRDAQRAVAASTRSLESTTMDTPEIEALARRLRKLRENNHFSERLVRMLREESEHPNVGR